MATVSNSEVTIFTPTLSWGGCPIEIWRVSAGAAPDDTTVITPSHMNLVKAVIGPGQSDVAATGSTSVTFTIGGNGSTATVGQIDIILVGFPR